MLEIKVVTDENLKKSLCERCEVNNSKEVDVLAATDGAEVLAFTVFELKADSLTLLHIFPKEDILMADGMVRSTMHVAVTRGIDKLYYSEGIDEDMLNKLGLIKSLEEKTLDHEALFRDKCCGK